MSFLGSGDGKMGHSSSAVNDQGLSGDASFQSRGFGQQGGPHVGESPMSLEEDTPRGERPPVLSVPSLAGGGQGHDETSTESANGKSEKSGCVLFCAPSPFVLAVAGSRAISTLRLTVAGALPLLCAAPCSSPSPSYFPYSPDESISPRSEVPPHVVAPPRAPTQAEASFAPSSHPSTHVLAREPPPSAFRSPSYPPASASSSSGGISAVRPSARSYSHQTNPSVSTTSTGQSQADSWRSSIFSTTSSSSASSFSSSSSCSVSTPVLPRPWLASDQLLHKGDSVDIRDEDALVVETTDESYVVVACLPGFSCVFSIPPAPSHGSLTRPHRVSFDSLDCITLATKSRRTLHIVADRWEREHSAHFERKVTFGTDADLSKIRAQFDGSMLRVTVSRRPAVVVSSSASFTSSVHDKPMFSAHRGSSPLPLAGAAGTSSPWGTGSESWAPARPSSTRSSAPGLLDRVSSSNSTSTVGSDDGDKNSSTTSTLRAKSPDAATKVLQQAARQSNDLDEYLARARARDGDKYTS